MQCQNLGQKCDIGLQYLVVCGWLDPEPLHSKPLPNPPPPVLSLYHTGVGINPICRYVSTTLQKISPRSLSTLTNNHR